MTGREDKKANDLFYTCSLIEYIARKTKNQRSTVVDCLGSDRLQKIYDLAEVYHSDNIETVSEDFIQQVDLAEGEFDNVEESKYATPSHWDIGKVYKRLIMKIVEEEKLPIPEAISKAYHSFVSDKIQDYNSAFYYDAPQNIYNAYSTGKIE